MKIEGLGNPRHASWLPGEARADQQSPPAAPGRHGPPATGNPGGKSSPTVHVPYLLSAWKQWLENAVSGQGNLVRLRELISQVSQDLARLGALRQHAAGAPGERAGGSSTGSHVDVEV